jgi:hypothetical protein
MSLPNNLDKALKNHQKMQASEGEETGRVYGVERRRVKAL